MEGNKKTERSYYPHANGISLKQIVKHNFELVYSAWYYALYDREAFIKAQKSIVYFNENWGNDFATYLSFIFSSSVVGSDNATFYQRDTGVSGQTYRPKTAREQYVHYRDFWKEMIFHINKSELSLIDKISLAPILFRYAKNVVKPRKILQAFIKEKFARKESS